MDDTVFVMFLLTGFCVPLCPSSPNVYYFIRESKDWYKAQQYCISEYTSFAQTKHQDNITALMNLPKRAYTGKAWIGVYGRVSHEQWTWVDDQPAEYFSWRASQPDNGLGNELCVFMFSTGYWEDDDCLKKKASVCYDGNDYILNKNEMTWNESKTNCENRKSTLVTIPDKKANSKIQHLLSQTSAAWIGLRQSIIWYWSTTQEIGTTTNWQPGQPDMLNDKIICAAMEVKDGTWTDEPCNATYPFFCQGSAVYKARKTVVKVKIESTANMEDLVNSENLLKQLHGALAKRGVSDFQLTWKKLPVKEGEEEEMASEDKC